MYHEIETRASCSTSFQLETLSVKHTYSSDYSIGRDLVMAVVPKNGIVETISRLFWLSSGLKLYSQSDYHLIPRGRIDPSITIDVNDHPEAISAAVWCFSKLPLAKRQSPISYAVWRSSKLLYEKR